MKKSKLSVGLVTAFIGALALAACDSTEASVTAKDNTIIDFVGYNNTTDRIEVKTGLYDEIGNTDEGTKLYYNAVLESLIRSQYESLSNASQSTSNKLKKYSLVKQEANSKFDASYQTAKETASSSGTTVEEEWNKVLESHDCETDEDLKQYYIYDIEKEELTDWYSKANEATLKNQYIGVNSKWQQVPSTDKVDNVDSVYPYHILHILVTLSANKSDYVRGTITSAEAKNLWDVVRKLIDSDYDFQQIAMNKSDDTGSKDKYGDVEIMSTKTEFYNEFKLGIYAYDALLSQVNALDETGVTISEVSGIGANTGIYQAMGLYENNGSEWVESEVVTATNQEGETKESIVDLVDDEMVTNVKLADGKFGVSDIPQIPFDVFRKIGEVADDEKLEGTNIAPEAGDVALPRNVLFNQFLNFHSPFIITDQDIDVNVTTGEVTTSQHEFEKPLVDPDPNGLYLSGTNFSEFALPGISTPANKVLTDKEGNVIIGVRSEAGIHFMVMRKSVFYGTNVLADKSTTSLEDYYTTEIPSSSEYPEGDIQTFVNMAQTDDKSYYTKRADTIKSELKSSTFDAAFDYRLYEMLMKKVGTGIKFFDEDVEGNSQIRLNIENYIKLLRETKHNGDIDSINESWQSYLMMLRNQNEIRDYEGSMIPTTCAFKFNKDNKADFEEGGVCYVKK